MSLIATLSMINLHDVQLESIHQLTCCLHLTFTIQSEKMGKGTWFNMQMFKVKPKMADIKKCFIFLPTSPLKSNQKWLKSRKVSYFC